MSSTNGGRDPAEDAVKNAEIVAPNAWEAEKELPLADVNIISQVETNVSGKEPSSSNTQGDTGPQAAENIQSEAEKTQTDRPNEELIEDFITL